MPPFSVLVRRPKTSAKRRLAQRFDRLFFHTRPRCMPLRDFGADESADEMLAVNPDYQNLVELLGAARNDMVVRLAAAMTITRDASLRERLAEIASIDPGREFLIGQSKNQSWLKVGGCGHSISRRRQTGLPTRTRPEFERSLQVSMQRTGVVKDAYNVLEPLFEPSLVQSRASFHEIFEWAPYSSNCPTKPRCGS